MLSRPQGHSAAGRIKSMKNRESNPQPSTLQCNVLQDIRISSKRAETGCGSNLTFLFSSYRATVPGQWICQDLMFLTTTNVKVNMRGAVPPLPHMTSQREVCFILFFFRMNSIFIIITQICAKVCKARSTKMVCNVLTCCGSSLEQSVFFLFNLL